MIPISDRCVRVAHSWISYRFTMSTVAQQPPPPHPSASLFLSFHGDPRPHTTRSTTIHLIYAYIRMSTSSYTRHRTYTPSHGHTHVATFLDASHLPKFRLMNRGPFMLSLPHCVVRGVKRLLDVVNSFPIPDSLNQAPHSPLLSPFLAYTTLPLPRFQFVCLASSSLFHQEPENTVMSTMFLLYGPQGPSLI